MKRRVGLLAAALVVALFGTTAVYAYVNRVEAKTISAGEPVRVLVAAARIPTGTTGAVVGANAWARFESVPRRNVPAGALTSLDAVAKKQAVTDLYPGEVLMSAKFTDQEQARTGALAIPADKLAVSVQLEDPARVAGFVVPGSDITVLATWEDKGQGPNETITHTAVILPRVQVIAVGPSTLQRDGRTGAGVQDVPTAILTLALGQKDAEKLVLAQKVGELYLGLVSEKSTVTADGGVTNDALGRGGRS